MCLYRTISQGGVFGLNKVIFYVLKTIKNKLRCICSYSRLGRHPQCGLSILQRKLGVSYFSVLVSTVQPSLSEI